MKEIQELIQSFVKSAQYIDDNYMDRVVKTHNSHERNIIKITDYLEKNGLLNTLKPLLKHPTNNVRLSAAFCLLPIYEDEAKEVYFEIINMNIPLMSYNAKISLEQWEENKKNTQ